MPVRRLFSYSHGYFFLLFFPADLEPREAEAIYDYSARSSKELSFKKGDIIQVFKRFNPEWWDGTINGTEGFVPARYIRMLTDDDVDANDGEGNISISGELSPSPKISSSGIDRPRDLPPRIPKREGSLRGRDSLPSPTADHASHAAASPIGASPIGVSSQGPSPGSSSFKKTSVPAISSEDIVKRQLTRLRKAPREESDNSVDKTPDKEQGFVIPRLRSISPTRKSQSPSQEKAEEAEKKEEPTDKDWRGGGEASKEENRKSVEGVWQPREEVSIPANNTPQGISPTTTAPAPAPAPKIPPAVRPKPKGNRNPQPPFRKNSDDLLASLQAAQVVRSHRTSGGPDDNRKSGGSVGDDTAF